MIDETVILLSQLEDCSGHRLAKYIPGHLEFNTDIDIYFRKPLQQVFSKVIAYDFTKRMIEIGVKGVNEEVIGLVRREHPKYVLWLSATYEILESTFDIIREEGSIVVGWFFDDEYRFAHYSKWWVPHLDYCVTFDVEALPKYKALGARVIPELCCEGIPIERDWSNIEEKYDVSFVGWRDKAQREQYINEIKKRNIPVHLFGRGWEGGYVSTEEMIDIFKTSKINLNFSMKGSGIVGIQGRITFVCLAGGFLLTEYATDIERYFEIGKEIACFKNAEEMIEKITYYLNHDEERRAIAQAGWKRATNEYTPFHMLSRVFDEIEKDLATGDRKTYPQKLKMPIWVRNSPSQYYFQWGKAFLEEGYDGLGKDAIALSLSYNPYNIAARYYNIIGSAPAFMRPPLCKLYLPFRVAGKLCTKVLIKLLGWADSIPYLRNLKQRTSKELHYS